MFQTEKMGRVLVLLRRSVACVRAWAFLLICFVASGVFAAEATPLRLGIMPFNSALALIKTHQPLRQYLEAKLNRKVEIYTSADY